MDCRTESGETMRAAGLKAISTVMDTSAWLISSKNPTNPELVEKIKARIQGVISQSSVSSLPRHIPDISLQPPKNMSSALTTSSEKNSRGPPRLPLEGAHLLSTPWMRTTGLLSVS